MTITRVEFSVIMAVIMALVVGMDGFVIIMMVVAMESDNGGLRWWI